jgi:hypothetical protein
MGAGVGVGRASVEGVRIEDVVVVRGFLLGFEGDSWDFRFRGEEEGSLVKEFDVSVVVSVCETLRSLLKDVEAELSPTLGMGSS